MNKLIVLLFLTFAGSAFGQYGELWFSAGKSIFNSSELITAAQGGPVDLRDGFRFGFRIGFNNDVRFGHEFMYAYSRTHLDVGGAAPVDLGGMAAHTAGYNFLLYATQEGARVRPFATGGVGFTNYVPPGSSAAQGGGATKYGVNYGGGVKVRVGDRWAIRFDLRQYTTPKPTFFSVSPSGWIRQTEATAGFGFVF